ncbi:hypothetical protein [Paraburkholderia youngii]|uniref:hypothetical protein n=1 Tax=Paraburkholderia youngii TaxID=2782701 RepID=UPI001591C036|nr:hypothetical protein [Paraburkholderia youngii]NUX58662.1 hypothetical protein [Paraburkholderia youngii]
MADRVWETTTTTGTGALSLAGTVPGYVTFSSVCSNGDTCYYALQSVDGVGNPTGAWEVGVGTYNTSGNTLSRTTVLASSNGGALVSLATGTTQVWLDFPAFLGNKVVDTPTIFDSMTPAMRLDALSGAPALDHTAAVQAAFNSGVSTLTVPSGAVFRLTGPLTISNKMRLTGNGELRFVSGVVGSACITVSADYCEFDNIYMTNPNLLQQQTGNRMSAITFLANYGKVVNSTIRWFQHGVVVESSGEFHDFVISNNKILDCIGAGDGPSNTTSTNGEDRGDGITVWGCCATITGNLVTAMAGQDCRVGIHQEGLPNYHGNNYPYQENLATISGNVVRGSFRRSIVFESVYNGAITGNVCQGATWGGIESIRNICCTISGNTILYTRAANDQTGAAFAPIHAGINLYGGNIDCVVTGNAVDTSRGFADVGIDLQGLNTNNQTQVTQTVTANGTSTIVLSAIDPRVVVGELVTGTGVPANTFVLSINGANVILNNVVTTGTPSVTFTLYDRGQNNVVTNNNVLCNGANANTIGIAASYQDSAVINANAVRQATTYGISCYDVSYPVINGNNLVGFKSPNAGVQLNSNATSAVVVGNLITGFTAAGAVGIQCYGRVGGVVSSNYVNGSPTDIDFYNSTNLVATGNNSVGATSHYVNGGGTGMTLANNTYS